MVCVFRLTKYKPGQIFKLCYDVCKRADHDVALCYRTGTAKIET